MNGKGSSPRPIQVNRGEYDKRWDNTFKSSKILNDIYVLVSGGKPDEAIDVLFDYVDGLLCDGNFDECNDLLNVVDFERLDSNLVVGFLSITISAKDKLRSRSNFVERAEGRLKILAPDRVDNLMSGLR